MNTNRCTTNVHDVILSVIPFAPGDVATIDGETGTVYGIGVLHRDGVCTPAVRFVGGRVVEGTRILYL